MNPDLTQGGPIYGPFISRKQAQEQGLAYYFNGKPCKAGHHAIRNVSDWGCKQCREKRKIERRAAGLDLERARAYSREYRAADPERHFQQQRAHDAKRKTDPVTYAKRRAQANARYCPEKQRIMRKRYASKRRQQQFDRYQIDIDYRLTKCLRARLHAIVRRGMGAKTGSTFDLLSCTLNELRSHLETQFADGIWWVSPGTCTRTCTQQK